MSLVPFPTTSPCGTHSLLSCVSALNEGSDCTSRRSDLLPPKCLCRENSGIQAGLFLTLTWQKEKMNTPKHAWAQGARLTALCQSHLIFKLLGLSVEGMRILLMYPTGWCCLWQISFWCQKPKYSHPFPLHKLLSPQTSCHKHLGELTKAALCVHASHCLFHAVINGVSGFVLILKRLWH